MRGRLVGRRRARGRRHRHGTRVLRRAPTSAAGTSTTSRRPQEYWKWFGAFKDMHDRLREIGKPTIARINGIAVGGGNELQIACDLAVIVDDAYIRHVGLEHGSVPAGGATQWLQLIVGDRRAREIILLCDQIPAAQAAEWGLVNRAVPAAELDAVVDAWVESLARSCRRDPLREAAAQRVARPRLASDRRTRPGLARAVDALGRDAGRRRFLDSRGRLRAWPTRCSPSRDGAVLTITLNRPDVYNAFNRALHAALHAALTEAADPPSAPSSSPAPGKGFCAGQDLREFAELDGLARRRARAHLSPEHPAHPRARQAGDRRRQRAGGGRRALARLRLRRPRRVRARPTFVPGFVGIGLVPDSGGTWFIHRLLGFARAFEWMSSNRRLDADGGARLGARLRGDPRRRLRGARGRARRDVGGAADARRRR